MLTDAELLELEELERLEEIDEKRERLKIIDEKTPKNYAFIYEAFTTQKYEGEKLVSGYKGVVLEGSARSRKTFSAIDFFIYVGLFVQRNIEVTIVRETYNEFKTTIYKDFRIALDEYGLDNPFDRLKEVSSFKIGKCRITFVGADQAKKFDGLTSDIVYFNEAIPIDEIIVQKATMRCNWGWIIDYNPSVTQHYIFDKIIPRKDVGFLRTTFRDNPLVPIGQKLEIMGYEPWLPGSYTFDLENGTIFYNGKPIDEDNQPPPHPENMNSTADEFMWRVYGLGLRGSMKGLIFPAVTWIDSFPADIYPTYGVDFGFTTDPMTVVKHGEDSRSIFLELLHYAPCDTPEDADAIFTSLGISKYDPITADSSDRHINEREMEVYRFVNDLFEMGWEISKVMKVKTVVYWIKSMKRKRIYIVKNDLVEHARKEQENYKWKEVNGIQLNQPEDKFNHFWDGGRYSHMAHNTDSISEETN